MEKTGVSFTLSQALDFAGSPEESRHVIYSASWLAGSTGLGIYCYWDGVMILTSVTAEFLRYQQSLLNHAIIQHSESIDFNSLSY